MTTGQVYHHKRWMPVSTAQAYKARAAAVREGRDAVRELSKSAREALAAASPASESLLLRALLAPFRLLWRIVVVFVVITACTALSAIPGAVSLMVWPDKYLLSVLAWAATMFWLWNLLRS